MFELEHSPLGGSGAFRFLNCEFSFLEHRRQLAAGEFENVESEFAVLGTDAHEAAAKCLTDGLEPFELLGETFGRHIVGWPDGIKLDALNAYTNECRRIIAQNPDGVQMIEKTIHLPNLHPLLKGTVDFGYYNSSWRAPRIYLRDYKNGEGVGVVAADNEQLLYYAFLMIMSDPWLRALDHSAVVDLGIVQPNFYGIFEDPDIWITSIGHVLDWGHNVLLPRMWSLYNRNDLEPSPDLARPGDHCQFCPVMLDCPALRGAFERYAEASEDFIIMLSDREISDLYAERENARRFMKALENTVLARKINGRDIPSAKLVEKKTARVWKPGAHAAVKAALGPAAMTTPEIKSPAQIEKISSRGKELATEWAYKPESSGLTVAPLSDPRAEAKPRTNANVFDKFAQSPEQMGF